MKEFKGTNGEWKIQEPYNTFVYGSDGKLICQIKYDPFSEESTANAMIIAAAPEMLKALQTIAEYWNTSQKGNLSLNDHVEHSLKLAEEAINKALGL